MIRPVAAAALLLLSCRGEDQKTGTITAEEAKGAASSISPEVLRALNEGNEAYRRKDYAKAKDAYTVAARGAAELPAPWFGLYMANRALGDEAGAREALEKARSLAPGATLVHPVEE